MTSYESLESRCQWLEKENESLKKRLELAEAVCGSIFIFDHTERDGTVYYLNEAHLEAWRLANDPIDSATDPSPTPPERPQGS